MHYNNGKNYYCIPDSVASRANLFFFCSLRVKVEFDTKVIQNFGKSLCTRQFIQNANIFKAFLSQLSFPSATFGVVNWDG